MTPHHIEAFIEYDIKVIGWQCFTCPDSKTGFDSVDAAFSDAEGWHLERGLEVES